MWSVPREWEGDQVVILAGGPSVLDQDLSLLADHRVIAINSAWKVYPQADILFFADARWWRDLGKAKGFSGLIVTTSVVMDPRVQRLSKAAPVALSKNPQSVALARSSTTGAINLAVHLGASKIVLLGVDGQKLDGKRHNHGVRYPWPPKPKCYEMQAAEFRQIAKSVPVPVFNASPNSTLDVWPKAKLEDLCVSNAEIGLAGQDGNPDRGRAEPAQFQLQAASGA